MAKRPPRDIKKDGKPVKMPRDVYDDLERLLILYPTRALGELAAERLRPALEEERPLLDQMRALQEQHPDKNPKQLAEFLIASGLAAQLAPPPKRRK